MRLLDRDAPFWELGFRPFFLLGAIFGAVAIARWLALYFGTLSPEGALDPVVWHAHEMIYGYTAAVIAGFVLTAAANWTGMPGVRGRKLQGLVAVWIAARLLLAVFSGPSLWVALVDLAFFPILAAALAPYLRHPDTKVERVFFAYFALFFCGNALVHLDALGILRGFAHRGNLLGLNTILLAIVFIGGRVIPFFTESSIVKKQPRVRPWIEILSHVSAWAFLIATFFGEGTLFRAVIGISAALIHLARLAGWQVRRVRRVPLIWILHLSYLWIVLGFFLSALASLGIFPPAEALHAFTVGGIGSITYGMMSRVSLGHTGRRLHPSAWVVVGYVLVNAAAACRVFGPLFRPFGMVQAVRWSGWLWVIAFGLFAIVYGAILTESRKRGS